MDRVTGGILRGLTRVIDVDLSGYFDNIRHHLLLEKVARRVRDDEVMHLLRLILKANGKKGVAQGGVISPLLSNVHLNSVDEMMERLQSEGVRGADLVFACIGPALEIFSRYSKVVDAEEREIPLGGDPEAMEPHVRGFLSYVWEVVGRTALEQVLGTAEARARNSMAGALEEDAQLTALFLWTLQSTNGNMQEKGSQESEEEEDEGEEEEAPKKKKKAGYSLIFDVVRRFAQPLGIHLPEWEGRIIETEKGIVRLLSIQERAKALFGEDGAQAVADR